jgi:hypothetical protein
MKNVSPVFASLQVFVLILTMKVIVDKAFKRTIQWIINFQAIQVTVTITSKLALTVAKKIVGYRVLQAAVIVFIITVKLKHVKIA